MNKSKFEWYVINGDFNTKATKMWNIFNNWLFAEDVDKHLKAYSKGKLNYNEFKEEVRKSLAWQEWGRTEYEIYAYATPWHEEEYHNKFDAYEQVKPNLDILCHYLLSVGINEKGK